MKDSEISVPPSARPRGTALRALQWIVALAATLLAVGAIIYVAYMLIDATRPA